jgi:amidase
MSTTRDTAAHWSLARYDAHGQAELVKRGEIDPGAPIEAAIRRIEEADPELNSVSYRSFEHARAAISRIDRKASMALVPYLLKASVEYPGFPAVAGSRARRNFVAREKYPFAAALDRAGLVPVGMSTMPEFGLLVSGEALVYGPTRNPWDLRRSTGGSSSGAAAAVAAGLVPLAHASDAAGSIRVPASHCGIIGFKPSRGWNLRARGWSWIQDVLCSDGLYARSVRDAAWAARHLRPESVLARTPVRRLRIAVDMTGLDGSGPDADVAQAVMDSAALCADLGHHVEERRLPIDGAAAQRAIETLWLYLGGEIVDFHKLTRPTEPIEQLLEPWTLGLAARRSQSPPHMLASAYAELGRLREAVTTFAQSFDVVLSPVARGHAPLLGELAPTRAFDELWQALFSHVAYTPLHNLAGTPSVSLPLFAGENGLPIGALFSAAPGEDELLLHLAAELEAARPWADRWPPSSTSCSRRTAVI